MSAHSPPNVAFIPADNVGWGDVSGHRGTVPTPHIDAPIGRGARWANYNFASQSRSAHPALLTERPPGRTGNCRVPWAGQSEYGRVTRECTFEQLSPDAGDATAASGKWNDVEHPGDRPTVTGVRIAEATAEAAARDDTAFLPDRTPIDTRVGATPTATARAASAEGL